MNYKKTIKDNITYHLINTSRFNQITVSLYFTKDFERVDLSYAKLLTGTMVYSTKKYNTKSLIAQHGEDLYGAKVSAGYNIYGRLSTYSFTIDFINPIYTEEKYLDLSLDFLESVIIHPNTTNNHFNDEHFNIVKKDTIKGIESVKDNPNLFASIRYANNMYKGTPSEYGNLPNLDDVKKISSSDLYKYYLKLLNGEYKVDVVILGNVSDSIIDNIHSRFKIIKSNNKKLDIFNKINYNFKENEIVETLKFNQSKLMIGYRLINMNAHEINHVLRVYNTILGTMNDSILFNIVREANSLCYSIGSYTSRYNPSLTIYAGINKDNYDKTLKLIKECVESMSNKKKVERLFDSAKKTINTFLNNYYDDSVMQMNDYYLNEFDPQEDIETIREKINKVTIEEVINLNKKIKLSTVYMLRGE